MHIPRYQTSFNAPSLTSQYLLANDILTHSLTHTATHISTHLHTRQHIYAHMCMVHNPYLQLTCNSPATQLQLTCNWATSCLSLSNTHISALFPVLTSFSLITGMRAWSLASTCMRTCMFWNANGVRACLLECGLCTCVFCSVFFGEICFSGFDICMMRDKKCGHLFSAHVRERERERLLVKCLGMVCVFARLEFSAYYTCFFPSQNQIQIKSEFG
jgi:hypothetical protein